MAGYLVAAFRVPTRRACHVVQCNRATFYYRSQRRDLTPLRIRLRELAAARPRFGHRRLRTLLRREGRAINHKKTYRRYRSGNGTTMRSGRVAPWEAFPSGIRGRMAVHPDCTRRNSKPRSGPVFGADP